MYRHTSFTFDGQSSTDYDLMIYFLDDSATRELSLGTDVDIMEDRLYRRHDSISYGVNANQALSFPLVFGSTKQMSDSEVDEILTWLTGHQKYKWLEFIDYDDFCDAEHRQIVYPEHRVRYKCHINNVEVQYIQGLPFAFTAVVQCDGQFAYELPITFTYEVTDSQSTIVLNNPSSYNGYIYPEFQIIFTDSEATSESEEENEEQVELVESPTPSSKIQIINVTDNNRMFEIDLTKNGEDITFDGLTVNIDNQNGIITNNSRTILNLYPYFNNKFFRLLRGNNELKLKTDTGSCTLRITCEFLRKVAGH